MAHHLKHPDTKRQCALGVGAMDEMKIVLHVWSC